MARKKAETVPSGPKKPAKKRFNFSYIYVAIFLLLTIAYLCESILPKPDKAILSHYHLSRAGYYWLVDPLVTILVIIWLISLYGSLRVKSYARLISNSKDGKGMNLISNGLLTLTLSLPITSNVNYVLGHIARDHHNLQPTMTIIINYVALGLMALAMVYIFAGGHLLYRLLPRRIAQFPQSLWLAVFIFASSMYASFIVVQPLRHPLDRHIYYLPDWLMVLTIAAPYMFAWYLGVRGAYNIFLFRRNIRGKIYRSALSYLAAGIAVVILSSVATRIITSLSSRITNLQITPLLIIIYALLALIAIGYFLIAVGAKKLRNIEEV